MRAPARCRRGRGVFAAYALLCSWGGLLGAGGKDPDASWVGIYGWIQAGERLERGEHWPLALGCFIEAHRQAERLRGAHPAYEPEMLAYRIPKLQERIDEVDARLGAGDHEIMTKFLDFIDSLESGLDQRYANRYPEALDTLNAARILLDEILYEKPEEFHDALSTQHDLLHGSLVWLEGQIHMRERSRPIAFSGPGGDWGTTQFVEFADLPADGDTILASASLFPFTPSPAPPPGAAPVTRAETEEEPAGEAETEGEDIPNAEGLKPFRMSTRQQSAAAPPDPGEKSDG